MTGLEEGREDGGRRRRGRSTACPEDGSENGGG